RPCSSAQRAVTSEPLRKASDSNLPESVKGSLLQAHKDIAYTPELIDVVKNEAVFKTSLLRYVSLSVIKGQFARVLEGKSPLTNFEFKFIR
ncbi:hypothetical protein O5625_25045, partial [Escherichia coli]|nr:hypothetical protein [Escherichia coli]